MKRVIQVSPRSVKVESVIKWPKCVFCGSCHAADMSKCPRLKSFDEHFGARKH